MSEVWKCPNCSSSIDLFGVVAAPLFELTDHPTPQLRSMVFCNSCQKLVGYTEQASDGTITKFISLSEQKSVEEISLDSQEKENS